MIAKKEPPAQLTKPETFILESLTLEDEQAGRLDGRLLFEVLKLQGKNPKYYYFRTQRELIEFAKAFRESGYRYLHLSCHGSDEGISYTFGRSSYTEFAGIFDKKLLNRRLFVSGCNLGNIRLAQALFETNGGMYSMTGSTTEVFFHQSLSFWSTFYYMMHAWDSSAMKKEQLERVFSKLARLFEMSIAHYYRDTSLNAAVAEQIFTARSRRPTASIKAAGSPDKAFEV